MLGTFQRRLVDSGLPKLRQRLKAGQSIVWSGRVWRVVGIVDDRIGLKRPGQETTVRLERLVAEGPVAIVEDGHGKR